MNAINPIHAEREVDELLAAVASGCGKTASTSETLPPAAYSSEAFFGLEQERIFRTDWVCVGHVGQVPNVGDYFTVDVAGEPLIIVRTKDGVRAISRVCLHRWAPVATGSGNAKRFVCPFHLWSYRLDGQLVGGPYMEKAEGFDPSSCRLPQFSVEVPPDLGFIFVNISGDAEPIGPRLKSFSDKYANWKLAELAPANTKEQDFAFNWKIQIETFMECYHHIGVHLTTFEAIQPARISSCESFGDEWTVCHSPYPEPCDPEVYTSGLVVCPDLDEAEKKTCDYVLIYPNLLLAIRPDTVSVLPVIPKAADRCSVVSFQLVRPESAAEPGLLEKSAADKAEFMKKANAEDTGINELQQATLVSRYARPGRLSYLETTVWDLANYVRRRVLS